ncbi:MAG: DegT/DnrJ/EryC1/StrS family aminotransferase [Firmicutes bacterium]|nr:DegT/DnrJ/EryC1/StrS family aminotransferase [Bacillota bacterium]
MQLEAQFSRAFGFAGAVAVGFGRAALAVALRAVAPEGRGERVLVPDFICSQVLEAVRQANATPAFFPVRRDLTVDVDAFRAALDGPVRAAVVVHYFGRVQPDVAVLAEMCRQHGVPMIEDCAMALGAHHRGRPAGRFADVAVFSLTKSDWCYGGGIIATNSPEIWFQLQERAAQLHRDDRLCFSYGVLRWLDWLGNRRPYAWFAETVGRWLERRWFAETENFFEAGRCDVVMSRFAAPRALTILLRLDEVARRRSALLAQLRTELAEAADLLWPPIQLEAEADSAAFVLLRVPDAMRWRERAAAAGVTLRLCWPAYQPLEPAQRSAVMDWIAQHLLFMEVHPRLSTREVRHAANVLRTLRREAGCGWRLASGNGFWPGRICHRDGKL